MARAAEVETSDPLHVQRKQRLCRYSSSRPIDNAAPCADQIPAGWSRVQQRLALADETTILSLWSSAEPRL